MFEVLWKDLGELQHDARLPDAEAHRVFQGEAKNFNYFVKKLQ